MIPGIIIPPGVWGKANQAPTDIALTGIPFVSTVNDAAQLSLWAKSHTNTILSNDSRTVQRTGSQTGKACVRTGVKTGRYYCEASSDTGAGPFQFGVSGEGFPWDVSTGVVGMNPGSIALAQNGDINREGVSQGNVGAVGTGRMRMDLDVDARTVRFALNGGAWSSAIDISGFISVGERVFLGIGSTANTQLVTIYTAASSWTFAAPSGAVPFPNGKPGLKGHGVMAVVDNATSVAPAYPTQCTISADDLILIPVFSDAITGVINVPAGYGALYPGDLVGSNFRCNVFWKRAAGGETGTVTITQSLAGGANFAFAAAIDVFNGVRLDGTPWAELATIVFPAQASYNGTPLVGAQEPRLGIQYYMAGAQAAHSEDNPADWIEIVQRTSGVSGDVAINFAIADVFGTEGGVGESADAATGVSVTSASWTFTLRPRISETLPYVQGMLVDTSTPIGTPLYTISGTDPDIGDTLTFSEVADPDNKFTISGNQVLLSSALALGNPTKWNSADKSADIDLSSNDLLATRGAAAAAWRSVRSTTAKSSGQWYFEVVMDQPGGVNWLIGVGNAAASLSSYAGADANSTGFDRQGWVYVNGGVVDNWGGLGTRVGIHLDLDSNQIRAKRDANAWDDWQPLSTNITSGDVYVMLSLYSPTDSGRAYFSASEFIYPIPSGASAWGQDAQLSHSLTIRATDPGGLTYDEVFGVTVFTASLRVSQEFLDVIYWSQPPTVRASQEFLDVVYLEASARAVRVTQEWLDVIYTPVNFVQNGDFDDTSIWILSSSGGSTATISGGTLNLTGDGSNYAIGDQQITGLTSGVAYSFAFTLATASFEVNVGTTQGGTTLLNVTRGVGSYVEHFVASGTTAWIRFKRASGGTGTVDNVAVY